MLKSDWTTDKFYQLPGKNGRYTDVHYVSLPKIKRNANIVFLEHGMDFKIDMLSMESSEGKCRLTADVILTDLDSDEQDITHIIATAPVSDKDASVALAFVQREYFASRFGIIDGLNFDEDEGENTLTNALYAKAVTPITDMLTNAVPDIVEVTTPMRSNAEIPTPVKKAEIPVKSNISAMEERGCVKTMNYIEEMKDKIDAELYEKAKSIFENRKTSADVSALLEIKREIESKQPAVQEGM